MVISDFGEKYAISAKTGATLDSLLLFKNKDIDKRRHTKYDFTGENNICFIGG